MWKGFRFVRGEWKGVWETLVDNDASEGMQR
jgi:hypothetical protein